MSYITNVLGSLTQGLNALLGGDRDQTFSSRSWEAKITGHRWGTVAVAVIDTLFWPITRSFGHCARAFVADTERTYAHAR